MLAEKSWRKATRVAIEVQAARTAAKEIKRVARDLEYAHTGYAQKKVEDELPKETVRRVILPAPERTEEEMREAALRLVNQELWDLEQKSQIRPLTLDENKRLKDLVLTLNQSQRGGKPIKKLPEEMTEEELELAAKGG